MNDDRARIQHPDQRLLEVNIREALNAVLSDHYTRTHREVVPTSVEVMFERRLGLFGGKHVNYVSDIRVELTANEDDA